MKEVRTSIEIQATAARVWQVLTDFDLYPEWLPFAPRISGALEEGKCLEAFTSGMSAKLLVRKVEPERELRWSAENRSILWNGETRFVIEPIGKDRVRFVRSELSSGILASLLNFLFRISDKRGDEQMCQALKMRAEQHDTQASSADTDNTVWPPSPITTA